MTNRRLCFMVTSSLTATTFLPGYLAFLRQEGWEVTLVSSDGPGLHELAANEEVSVHRLSMHREPSPIADLVSLFRAIRLLRKLKPGVLVYATPKASLIGALAGALTGIEVRVYELWGLRFETAVGIRRTVFRALEYLTCTLSTRVLANSLSLADLAMESFPSVCVDTLGAGSSHGVDGRKYVPDFVGPPFLDNESAKFIRETSLSTPVIGFIGRVHPDKGIDVLIDALLLLKREGQEVAAIVVGGIDDTATAGLIRAAQKHVRIHLVGHVSDTRPYIKAMSILVLPTLREGFPNVVLECAAMGVPAIVSDATGARDSVIDGETGWIFPVGDSVELAAIIASSTEDRHRSQELGIAARTRAMQDFPQHHVWKMHSDYFRRGI